MKPKTPKTPEQIEQDCYGISPHERVEKLKEWEYQLRKNAMLLSARIAIKRGKVLRHTFGVAEMVGCNMAAYSIRAHARVKLKAPKAPSR